MALSQGVQAQLLNSVLCVGELTRPDGSRFETDTGYKLAEARVVASASDEQIQQAIDLDNKARAAPETPTAFKPSDEWALKKDMKPFPVSFPPVPHAARSTTSALVPAAGGPMARFFTNDPAADTYDNAEDKEAWLAETSGAYDWRREPSIQDIAQAPADAGCMCPVEYGGSHTNDA